MPQTKPRALAQVHPRPTLNLLSNSCSFFSPYRTSYVLPHQPEWDIVSQPKLKLNTWNSTAAVATEWTHALWSKDLRKSLVLHLLTLLIITRSLYRTAFIFPGISSQQWLPEATAWWELVHRIQESLADAVSEQISRAISAQGQKWTKEATIPREIALRH